MVELLSAAERTEVVIVGAGPTGLTAAVRLAELGVPHVVLDSALAPTRTSNAALVHAATIELLAALGLGEELVRAGRQVHRIGMADRGRPLVRVGLTGLPSRYPFALGVPQSTTEQLLLHRLAELGGSVRRGHRVTSVHGEGTRHVVTGTVEPGGAAAGFAVSARYVIGADGAHSTVRSASGVEFPGETYPAQFVLADVALSAAGPDDEATINLSPRGVTVIGRLPGPNHRVIATVDPAAALPEAPDRRFLDELLAQRGIAARATAEPVWSSRFRVHHRVADRFRVDGVFLAGDAAHVHSPAAGQGMNTGIADAYDIATRLGAVLTGHAGEPVLDGYERQRRAAALEVLAFTDRLTKLAMLENPLARLGRRVAAGTVLRFPWPLQRRITLLGQRPGPQSAATGPPRDRRTVLAVVSGT